MMNNAKDQKSAQKCSQKRALCGFNGDEEFYSDYVESLAAGDLRPILIENYIEGDE